VSWLSRIGWGVPREAESEAAQREVGLPRVERSAPGIASLFSNLEEDGSHAVLDLGPASESSFRIYSRFARRIRFAGLLEAPQRGETWTEALRLFPDTVAGPFDLLLAWNVLDRVPPELRSPVVQLLARIAARGARLYVLVDASGESLCHPLRFTLPGLDRVSHQVLGEPYPAGSRLLPAEVKRVLEPFEVVQAFTLKDGFREYVAVRS
jgi:hypothetical protein